MRKVTLKNLTFENFKGRTMALDLSDGTTVIRGTNEAGKSTLTNAFLWLLTGTDAQDRTNYELFDTTLEYTPENAKLVTVEGLFDIDGTEYSLRRTAKQKWIRPRGKSEYVKDKSDEYSFAIDGLAVSANTYRERVECLFAPIDKLKIMLNVRYYMTLDWKKLRKHFSDLVGVIDESELTSDYTAIEPLLAKYKKDTTFRGDPVEAVKESLRQRINPLRSKLNENDSEIKGMKSMLPDLAGVQEAVNLIAKKTERIAEIDREIAGIGEANKPTVEARRTAEVAIAAKKESLRDAKWEYDQQQRQVADAIAARLEKIKKTNDDISRYNNELAAQCRTLESQLDIARQQWQFYSEERDKLHAEKEAVKAQIFDENQVCPTCGQALPLEQLAKACSKFNDAREARLKDIIERGVRARDNRDVQAAIILELENKLAAMPELREFEDMDVLNEQLAMAKSNILPFETTDEYRAMIAEIADMEAALPEIPQSDFSELIAKKKQLSSEISALQTVIGREAEYEDGMKRIAVKESETSEIGIELARLEGLFDLCVAREREWASIVRDRANRYLTYSRVEMTELTKAGELVDVCTLTARKVNSGSQNNATQIRIGADVALAFQKSASILLPMFIDNAEGIVDDNLPQTDGQLILLYVDKKYPTLTVC